MLFSLLAMEVVGETGRLVEAAVEGLRSWAGSGCRFRDADWMVEAMSIAGFDIVGGLGMLERMVLDCERWWVRWSSEIMR